MNQRTVDNYANASSGQSDTSGSADGSLISSDRVEGTKVLDRSGNDIGTIKRLKIDKVSGRVAYVVAEFGGFLGMGGHEYTIPWGALDYDPSKRGFRTDLTKEQLEGAPNSSRRPSSSAYRASGGGVGSGRRSDSENARPDSDSPVATTGSAAAAGSASAAVDPDLDNDDADWNRDRDRELYDYYAIGYYWEE